MFVKVQASGLSWRVSCGTTTGVTSGRHGFAMASPWRRH